MRDFVIRLASMKLAELKFDVEITTHYPHKPKSFSMKEMTLREIKSMLKNHVKSPGVFKSAIMSILNNEFYFHFEAYPMDTNIKIDYMEIDINCPEGMGEETFKQIIKSLGIPVKR